MTSDDPKYRYFPGVGAVRTNNAPKRPSDAWCPRTQSPQHAYVPATMDPRFEVCSLCGHGHRRPRPTGPAMRAAPAPVAGSWAAGKEGAMRQ